ncbi:MULTISPECIES: hypothetical protein [unclassified Streptomyces]|uniref:hypothetical protein n=1 Tax=unclassified Streptomyces TaxID=2593676 RepID=UPI00344DF3E2
MGHRSGTARAENGTALPVVAARRIPAVPAVDTPAAEPPVLTRATDEHVGEPRPATAPPVVTRSAFDVSLDAFRPAWLLERMATADDDLPSFVQARRAGATPPPAVARTVEADAPGGPLPGPSVAAPGPLPHSPWGPTAAVGGVAAPATALPGRRRRHPDGYRRTAAAAPAEPAAPASFDPAVPASPAVPSGSGLPAVPSPYALATTPGAAASTPLPDESAPDHAVAVAPGTAPHPAPPGTPPLTPLAARRRPAVSEGPAPRAGAPAPREADPAPRTGDEPRVTVDGIPPTTPAPDAAPGWEAAWSLRHARDRQRAPGTRTGHRPAAPDAVPPSTGRQPREIPSVPGAAGEEATTSAEEDPAAGDPAPGEAVRGQAVPDGGRLEKTDDDGAVTGAHRPAGPAVPTVPATPSASATPTASAVSPAPPVPTTPATPAVPAVAPAPVVPLASTGVALLPAGPAAPAGPPVPAAPTGGTLPVVPVVRAAQASRSDGGAPYGPHGPVSPSPSAPAVSGTAAEAVTAPPRGRGHVTVGGSAAVTAPDGAREHGTAARRAAPPAMVHRTPRSGGGVLMPRTPPAASAEAIGQDGPGGFTDAVSARPETGDGRQTRAAHTFVPPSGPSTATVPTSPGGREPSPRRALYVVPQYVASPKAEGGEPGSEGRADRLRGGAAQEANRPVGEPLVPAASWKALAPAMAVGSELTAQDLSSGGSETARTRAADRWFGAPPPALVHAQRTGADGHGKDTASRSAPRMSWSGEPGTGTVTAPGSPPDVGSDSTGWNPAASWTDAAPPLPGARHGGSGGGPGSGSGPYDDVPVPLDRTQEWADLLAMLADHRRQNPLNHLDDPKLLDALAARLQERVLAHIRRALVVDRERGGLLAPRS